MENSTEKNEKKTMKEIARDLKMSEKRLRTAIRVESDLEKIRSVVGDAWADLFEKNYYHQENQKKVRISYDQLHRLTILPDEMIQEAVEDVVMSEGKGKEIIDRHVFLTSNIKTTVTLPSYVNRWFKKMAKENNMSKTKYIESLLTDFYERNSGDV